MSSLPQLILCGSIAIDRIMNFHGTYKDLIKPDKLHVLSLSVLLKDLKDTRGGVGANIAYTLALLGERPVLLGAVGKGEEGWAFMAALAKLGVDTKYVHYSNRATASFNVMTDRDDNQVGGFYPGAMADSASLTLKRWKGTNAFVVVSPHDPNTMRRQVGECKTLKLRLFYDASQQINTLSAEDLRAGVAAAELLIVNDYEQSVLCQKIGMTPKQLKARVPVVVTTLGSKGSMIEGKNLKTPIHIAVVKPATVVDPTGAGDAYRAGFLYGYIRKWDLKMCGQMGSTAAAYVIEKHGTQEHHFTKTAFIARYTRAFRGTVRI